ncbi:MAG: hypothetical protein ACFFE2_09820 [Candidatus Thorarchaeota archaeon]
MQKVWYHIAKYEFLVLTSRFRHRRKLVSFALLSIGIVWALFLAPFTFSLINNLTGGDFDLYIINRLPGLVRLLFFNLWLIILLSPLTYALEEVKIGQWEIMLSNNVKTKDIMLGTFVSRLPIHGLTVLFLTPVFVTPFTLIYKVSILGQVVIYCILFLFYITTIWTSNFLNTSLQSKLGRTSRGSDFAKALSAIIGFVMILPPAIVVFLSNPLSVFIGNNVFAIFPFSWVADLITWIIVNFNGINLAPSIMYTYISALTFTSTIYISLMVVFFIGIIGLTYLTADRVFSIAPSVQSERVITVGEENIILRGIRRWFPTPLNILVVTAMKDFGRKARNIASLISGVILAIFFPLFFNFAGIPAEYLPFLAMWTSSMMLALTSGLTFGGLAILESKDQLWMIKSAANGVSKFVKSRIIESTIYGLPMAIITSLLVAYMLSLPLLNTLLLLLNNSFTVAGVILVCIGVTTNNPNYEDSKSKVFKDNTGVTMIVIIFISQASSIIGFITQFSSIILIVVCQTLLYITVGVFLLNTGKRRLASLE